MKKKNTTESARHGTTCLNCGSSLPEKPDFCPCCGQENKISDLRFKHFFHEFLSNNFNLDSKIFLTLKLLIFHPGKLTKEFLEGKRTKYVTPVRLYLIISLIYFSILSFSFQPAKSTIEGGSSNVVFGLNEVDSTGMKVFIQADTITEPDRNVDKLEKFISEKSKKLLDPQNRKAFNNLLRSYISIGMFVLIPLTALLLFILFYKNTFYIQHLVFIIHLQSLIFLVFTLFNLLRIISDWTVFSVLNGILFLALLLIWIKKFYVLKWWKAIFKSLTFLFLYGLLFLIFLAIVAGISFYSF